MATEGIVDASAIVSLVTQEEFSEWSLQHVGTYKSLITLELAYYEATSAIYSKVLKKELSKTDASKSLKGVLDLIDSMEVYNAKELMPDSLDLSMALGISTYDASYLSLARKFKSKLITLDLKLAEKLKSTPYSSIIDSP